MFKLFIVVNVDRFFLSHRKDIAINALKNGYDVTIITKDTGKRSEVEKLGLRFIDLPMNSVGTNIFEEIKTLLFLFRLYKRERPDIVHHVGLKTILWGTLAARIAKINGVVNAVSGLGIMFSIENKSIYSSILIRILRFSHNYQNLAVIFQNNEDKDLFIKNGIINEKQSYMIKGSGIDLNLFCYTHEPDDSIIKILFTARMIEEKGVFILTDAATKLKEKYRDRVQFLLCGGLDDNPKAISESDLKDVCDGEYIQWLGFRSNILDLLKQCHIVAFPSYYREGIPKSLIEATAIGRPIITTNSIGCKEAVDEGWNGYLIPIKDSETLALKLSTLIDNKELRQEMGRNSRILAEKNFSIENVINRHLEIYEHLINSKK
jgi:glycosyltransferase involved in cell wall biosynthesis